MMATKKQRNGGGGKLSRSEIIQVRLDPKLKFGAEMAAAKCRRTISSFGEGAIEEALKRQSLNEARRMARSIPI